MAPSMGAIFAVSLAALLLIFSGFASGSEIAFFSLSPNDINELEESNSEKDKTILALREDSERTLATILITNNLVNVTIIMLCTYFFDHVVDFGNAIWLQFLVITVLLTFLLLLFGEIMPKVYCGQHALAVCRAFCGSITFLRKLFYPLATILMKTGVLAEKVVQKENHVLSVDDLEQALELTDKDELKDEKNMLAKYYARTNDRIVTRADLKAFCNRYFVQIGYADALLDVNSVIERHEDGLSKQHVTVQLKNDFVRDRNDVPMIIDRLRKLIEVRSMSHLPLVAISIRE